MHLRLDDFQSSFHQNRTSPNHIQIEFQALFNEVQFPSKIFFSQILDFFEKLFSDEKKRTRSSRE